MKASSWVLGAPRSRSRGGAELGLGLLVGVVVVMPLLGGGWLLLLDWVSGPRVSFPSEAYGLDGGLLYGDFAIIEWIASRLVGPRLTQVTGVVVLFPVAAWATGRLVGGPLLRRVPAALFYCVNPFVFERLAAGQVALLAGYAVLPVIAAAFLNLAGRGWRAGWRAGVALAIGIALIVHTAWLAAVLLASAVVTSRAGMRPRLVGLSAMVLTTAALTAHLWLPQIDAYLPVRSDPRELAAFRTAGDESAGLLVNVIGLYGFWRTETAPLPKQVAPGWLFVLAALLALVVLGVTAGLRSSSRGERRLVQAMLISGVAGVVLALGDQGPLGVLYRGAFEGSALASIMREPQKFLALTALAYSVGLGFATERLARREATAEGRSARIPAVVLTVGAILLYTPTMPWGLGGHFRPSHFPDGWRAADDLMGAGDGLVLVLPWHRFVAFEFTHGVVVRNPAPHYFEREVIVGDNVQVRGIRTLSRRPRSAYLESLFRAGPTMNDFGARVAPLGVEYILLAETSTSDNYRWLDSQNDLEPVYEDEDVALYRNKLAASHPVLRHVDRISPTRFNVDVQEQTKVALPEPYDPGWRLRGEAPTVSDVGTVAFDAHASPGVATYSRTSVIAGWALTGLALIGSLWVAARKGRSARDR